MAHILWAGISLQGLAVVLLLADLRTGLLADGSIVWDLTAITLAIFAGSGPALVGVIAAWLKARAAHNLIRRTRKGLARLIRLERSNRQILQERSPVFARLERWLDDQEGAKKGEP